MNALDLYEARCNAAIARYIEARSQQTPDRIARPILADQLWKNGLELVRHALTNAHGDTQWIKEMADSQ